MRIELAQCVIRDWEPGDEAAIVPHANNRNVSRNLLDAFPYPYEFDHATAWIEQVNGQEPPTHFAIEIEGSAAGGIGLTLGSDVFRRSAEIGFWLGEAFWGRGIVTDALAALTRYSLSEFDLCRIFAGVFEWNTGSMRVLEKAGYTREALLKKSVTKDGQTIDRVIYAYIQPDS
jgi:ribosomal-protein-alanine N-acetyltransferase